MSAPFSLLCTLSPRICIPSTSKAHIAPAVASLPRALFQHPRRSYAISRTKGKGKKKEENTRGIKELSRDDAARDASRVVQKKPDKPSGSFRPLPASQLAKLTLPEGLQPSSLDTPIFESAAITFKSVASALAFSQDDNGPFKIFGLPKQTLVEQRVLSMPCSVIRDVTVETIKLLDGASQNSSRDCRLVLSGRPGCGKSYLLMQAVEYCVSKGWIVLYIPRAVNLVNSTTHHAYDLRTQTYLQPAFSLQVLLRFMTVNMAALDELATSQVLELDRRTLPAGTPLPELIRFGTQEQSLSPIILDTLMQELNAQTKFPVLLAVDDFQSLYCNSAYRDPHFAKIRPYHLSLPRLLLEYACGSRVFARGAVLGAINASDPLYTVPLELREALGLPHIQPPTVYDKRSETLKEYATGLQVLPVPDQLSIAEAASIYEIWMQDQAIDSVVPDEAFLAKYIESSGNARDFVWKGLLSTLGALS